MLLVPNYRKANFTNIRREMESVNWNQCLDNFCIDETYKTFTENLKSIVNENIPHKPRKINIYQPLWMTDSLQKIIAEKRRANKKFKLSQLISDFNNYVDLKRTCEKEIRKKNREYEVRISHKAKKNPKMFFSYIRNKKTVKK